MKNASLHEAAGIEYFALVPTARLELAQLSPLPPQDSVSTNFTTSALHATRENCITRESLQVRNFNSIKEFVQCTKRISFNFHLYFGTFEAGVSFVAGAVPVDGGATTAGAPRTPADG